MDVKKMPGARILEGRFTAVQQAVGTARKNTAGSSEGLRITIRGNNSVGKILTNAKVKIGRRVHFKIGIVAALLDGRV